jgi:hypothetical protein
MAQYKYTQCHAEMYNWAWYNTQSAQAVRVFDIPTVHRSRVTSNNYNLIDVFLYDRIPFHSITCIVQNVQNNSEEEKNVCLAFETIWTTVPKATDL